MGHIVGSLFDNSGGSLVVTDLEVDGGTISVDETNDRVGIGDTAPGTQLQMKSTAPYMTLQNSTVENTAGGCESKFIFEDHGNNALGQIEVSHVGSSDDEKGQLILKTNNDSGLQTALTISEAQAATFASTVTTTGITMAPANLATAISIDHDYSDTDAATVVGLNIDLDKTGASTSNNTMYGIRVDMDNTTATNGSNTMIGASLTPTCQHAAGAGTVMVKGLEVVATGGTPGTETARALDLTATGADYNQGIYMAIADGGPDLKMVSSADSGDFCTISVGAAGATTLVTVDDDGAAADLTLSIDGDFNVSAITSNTIHDYNTVTFESQLSSGQTGGEILKYSPGADDTLTVGGLYFLHTDGTWDATDADAVATGATQLLGIGMGNARTAGVLLKGYVRIPSTEILNTPGSGAVDGLPVYVSTTAAHLDFTQPSGGSDFVRIVGYAIDDDSGDVLIRFDPDSTHIEL